MGIGALAALALLPATAAARPAAVELELLGRTPAQGEGGAEIAAYAPAAKRIFAANAAANRLDVYDARVPGAPALATWIDLAPYGGGPVGQPDARPLVLVTNEISGTVDLIGVRTR